MTAPNHTANNVALTIHQKLVRILPQGRVSLRSSDSLKTSHSLNDFNINNKKGEKNGNT